MSPAAPLCFGVALASLGCTDVNPDYIGDGGGAADLSTAGGADLRHKPHDLALPSLPDLVPPPVCMPTERRCAMADAVSESCVSGQYALDRTCPMQSTCKAGYCQVPPFVGTEQGNSCNSESGCAFQIDNQADSCEPFVVDPQTKKVELHCAAAVGAGASNSMCTSGSDCRSGFCIAAKGTCFRACNGSDFDCPNRNGVKTVCRAVTIVVEGVDVMTNSCVAP
jgi:hypothetical protein